MNIKNSCLVAFGEIAQNLINFRCQSTGNKTKTPYWGLDKDLPLYAVDSREITGARDTQTCISLSESGTGGKDLNNFSSERLKGGTAKILAASKFTSYDCFYILIGLGGGTQVYAYALANHLKAEGKKVIFIVIGLTPFDNNREDNAIFGKSKLQNFSHTFLDQSSIDFENEDLPFEVQYMDLVESKLNDFKTLLSQSSLDVTDASNAIVASDKGCLIKTITLTGKAFDQATQVTKAVKSWSKGSTLNSMAWCISGDNARLTSLKLSSQNELGGLMADNAYISTKTQQSNLQEIVIFCSL